MTVTFHSRLIKLLGMLGSNFENERSIAGAKVTQLLLENNTTWSDIIPLQVTDQKRSYNPPPPPPKSSERVVTHFDLFRIRDRMLKNNVINLWEYDFLQSINNFEVLSEKQRVVANRIKAKAKAAKMV